MARLPSVLGTDDLHLAELCAARIDGELIGIADGWCPVDEPDLPSLRAAAVSVESGPSLIAERLTAAWVHGAVDAPPRPAQYCVPHSDRIAVRLDRRAVVREVALRDGDVIELGGVRCTGVERTGFDLLRDPEIDDDTVVAAVARLIAPRPWLPELMRARFDDATRMPHKARARLRLSAAEAQAGTHGVDEASPVRRALHAPGASSLDQPSLTR